MSDFYKIENRLGYTFNNKAIILEAFTHPSYKKNEPKVSYQRLELLGDSVLNLLITIELFLRFPDEDEGYISHKRSSLISKEACTQYMLYLNLALHIKAQDNILKIGTKSYRNILADVFEAILGAIFIDGGYDAVRCFFKEHLQKIVEWDVPLKNSKVMLQELCQDLYQTPPIYTITKEEGPDHNKIFYVNVDSKLKCFSNTHITHNPSLSPIEIIFINW